MNKLQDGYFLVSAIVVTLFLTAIGLSVAALTSAQYQHTKREVFVENAQLLAEASIEQSVSQLNADESFSGYTTPQEFFNNSAQGRGMFTSAVTDNADGSKTIVTEGMAYRNGGDTTPYITRKIEAIVVGTSSGGYSVQTGPGGLILNNNSSIVNSPVYVNGFIQLNNNARIGSENNPLNVNVANYQCPLSGGPSYPQVCTNGTQPIALNNNSRIYGTVCATGQTNASGIGGGNGGEGLKPGCVTPPVAPITYDRQAHIDSVAVTGSASNSLYTCTNNQTKTWPADLKLTGNVSLSNNCRLTITGDVYITGNLTLSNSARIFVADSMGTTQPVIMVDGTITVTNSSSMVANSSGTGAKLISFKSQASCNPDCTSLSGDDLKNSQGVITVSISNSAQVPGMVFQAYWGKITVSNSSSIGAVAGQTIELNNSGTVIFGTELASGSKTWAITSYRPLY
jgi:Tfp pilus assembly protein PilX